MTAAGASPRTARCGRGAPAGWFEGPGATATPDAPHSPAQARPGPITERPPSVWWARSGPGRADRMCEDPAHPVYVRRLARPKRGDPDALEAVDVYACAVCWPPGRGGW